MLSLHHKACGSFDFLNYAHSRHIMNFCMNELIQVIANSATVLCRVLATAHISHDMPMLKRKKMLKEFRHRKFNLVVLKWQLCLLRHALYLVPLHLPLMFAAFSLSHCAPLLLGQKGGNSEFNKLHYCFKSLGNSSDIYNEHTSPITIFFQEVHI